MQQSGRQCKFFVGRQREWVAVGKMEEAVADDGVQVCRSVPIEERYLVGDSRRLEAIAKGNLEELSALKIKSSDGYAHGLP